jgi:hypothetical protein
MRARCTAEQDENMAPEQIYLFSSKSMTVSSSALNVIAYFSFFLC